MTTLLETEQMAALLEFVLVAVDWEQTRPRALRQREKDGKGRE